MAGKRGKGNRPARPDPGVLAQLFFESHGNIDVAWKKFNSEREPNKQLAGRTFRIYLQDPICVRKFSELRGEATEEGMVTIQKACRGFADTICEIAREGESEANRLNAAKLGLEFARHAQLDQMEQRLNKLEEMLLAQNVPTQMSPEEPER